MNRDSVRRAFCCFFIVMLAFLGTGCAGLQQEAHQHGNVGPVKAYPKDYVHPLSDINLEKVIKENRGMKVVEANATTVHDYYRGSVQEKAEAEKLLKEGKLEEARAHFDKSNRFLLIVLRYLGDDEAYRNIYGDVVISFLPNLLMADNYLKLLRIFKKMELENETLEAERYGKGYLSRSLESVRTEWGYQIRIGFGEELRKK